MIGTNALPRQGLNMLYRNHNKRLNRGIEECKRLETRTKIYGSAREPSLLRSSLFFKYIEKQLLRGHSSGSTTC